MRLSTRSLLATALLLLAGTGSPAAAPASPSASPVRYLVLIVVDGFRPDYMQLTPMPHLQALMQTGTTYRRAWVGQLESQTPAAHATLATGAYPRKHGVMGFGWRDAATQGFSWMTTDLRQLYAGSMERLIESGGVPTLSDLLHRADPGAKAASMSGEKFYAADALGTGADYILYGKRREKGGLTGIHMVAIGRHVPPAATRYWEISTSRPAYPDVQDQLVADLGARLVQTVRPRLLLVNLPGTDIQGHISGGVSDPDHMRPVVVQVDRSIGELVNAYRRAGLYDRTIFVVTADHGMVPSAHIVPIRAMYAGVRQTGVPNLEDDLLTTAGYIFLRDPAAAPLVAAQLAARRYSHVEGAFSRVSFGSHFAFQADPATAQTLGADVTRAYIDLCNTIASPTGPEVVLPYTEDAMGLTVAGSRRWGNHGGLSWRVQHIPLVISGPGVRHALSDFPAQLADVAPTVERLLGWQVPKGVDGVVLADALRRPWARDEGAEGRIRAARSRDVQALLLHSSLQHAAVLASNAGRP